MCNVAAGKVSFTSVNIYRPPTNIRLGFDELANLLSLLDDRFSDRLVVCGDLNCFGLTETSGDDELLTVLEIYGFEQFVLGPTQKDPTSCSLLDPVIGARNLTLIYSVTVCLSFNVTDHRLLIRKLSTVRVRPQPITFQYRRVRSKFGSDIRSSSLFSNPASTVEEFVQQTDDVVLEALNKHAPLLTHTKLPGKVANR